MSTCDYLYIHMSSAALKLDVRPASKLFKALGDEMRLRMVALLSHGELCVCHLESALGLSQPNVSRQLSVLRAAGVVEPRREGSWMYYRLAPQADAFCKAQLKGIAASFGKLEQLGADVERLVQAKGPNACR